MDGVSNFIQNYGYWALLIVSILESALAPIPSEVTFTFAGALTTVAITGHAQFSMLNVILIGTLGSWIGSVIAYEVGRYLGRPIVDRWGKWVLLTHADLDRAEAWFDRWGAISVLVGRVIPFVRSFISLPAGLAEMRRDWFSILTIIGSAAWVALLAQIGHSAGTAWQHHIATFHKAQTITIVVVALLLVGGFLHRLRAVRRQRH